MSTELNQKDKLESLSFNEVLEYFSELEVEMPDFQPLSDVLKNEVYKKNLSDPLLKDKVILLAYGGSTAYGLNKPTSDTDIRGIFMPEFSDCTALTFKYALRHKDDKALKSAHPYYIYTLILTK